MPRLPTSSSSRSKRLRSSSLGRTGQQQQQQQQQARYWALLLQNLRRAVDDIYVSCEADSSVLAAKEAILVLENYTRDLRILVDWFHLQHTLENTPDTLKKKLSLAWEIRKTAPIVKNRSVTSVEKRRKANVDLGRWLEDVHDDYCPDEREEDEKSNKVDNKSADIKQQSQEISAHTNGNSSITLSALTTTTSANNDLLPQGKNEEQGDKAHLETNAASATEIDAEMSKDVDEGTKAHTTKDDASHGDETKVTKESVTKELNEDEKAKASRDEVGATNNDENKPASEEKKKATKEDEKETANEGEKQTEQEGEKETANEGEKQTEHEGEKETANEGDKETANEGEKETANEGEKQTANEGEKETANEGEKETANEGEKQTEHEGEKETANEGEKQTEYEGEKETANEGEKETANEGEKETANEGEKETTNGDEMKPALPTANSQHCGADERINAKNSSSVSMASTSTPKLSSSSIKSSKAMSTPTTCTSSLSKKPSMLSKSSFSKVVSSNIPSSSLVPRRTSTANKQPNVSGHARTMRSKTLTTTTTSKRSKASRPSLVDRQSLNSPTTTTTATTANNESQEHQNKPTSSKPSSLLPRSKTTSLIEKVTTGEKSKSCNKMSRSLVVRPSSITASANVTVSAKSRNAFRPMPETTYRKVRPSESSNPNQQRKHGIGQNSGKTSALDSKFQSQNNSRSKEVSAKGSHYLKHSWADLVKGKTDDQSKDSSKTLRKVDNKHGSNSQVQNSINRGQVREQCSSEKGEKDTKDNDGWHTVRPRARQSRPQTRSVATKENLLRRQTMKFSGFYYKDRFSKPSATISLPSLAPRRDSLGSGKNFEPENKDLQYGEERELLYEKKNGDQEDTLEEEQDTTKGESGTKIEKEGNVVDTVDCSTQASSIVIDWSKGLSAPFSWADEVELEEALEHNARVPGRAIQLHERLLSPASKKEPYEAFKEHERKMEEARMRREKIESERTQKLIAQSTKIESVKEQKEKAKNARRELFNDKMKRAEEKRMKHIDNIRKKAQEEEKKLKEIAFINELQAQNLRIDMLAHSQIVEDKHEERLASIAEERAKKAEEREAKEARAERQRRNIEQKREQSILALREKIRSKEERIVEEQEQQRRERKAAARLKEQGRIERLTSVRLAEQDQKEELQEKIAMKQEEAARRHQLKLDDVRRKAFELSVRKCSSSVDDSVPLLKPYKRLKKCVVCDVTISNEVELHSHLRGRRHRSHIAALVGLNQEQLEEHDLEQLVDVSFEEQEGQRSMRRERQRAMRRRSKKLKSRLINRANAYEEKLMNDSVLNSKFDAPNRGRIGKALREIERLLGANDEKKGRKGPWPDNNAIQLDRCLLDISRCLERDSNTEKNDWKKSFRQDICDKEKNGTDGSTLLNQSVFFHLEGFDTLAKIISLQQKSPVLPPKTLVATLRVLKEACKSNSSNSEHFVRSKICVENLDVLLERLAIIVPCNENNDEDHSTNANLVKVDAVTLATLDHLTICFEDLAQNLSSTSSAELKSCIQDAVSYLVSAGAIEQLGRYLSNVRDAIDSEPSLGTMIVSVLSFLIAIAKLNLALNLNNDPTHLLAAFDSDIVDGAVAMLYAVLLHQGAPRRTETTAATVITVKTSTSSSPSPPPLPTHTCDVLSSALGLLQHMFSHDLVSTQHALGREGISLEFRHIASHLLWYSVQHRSTSQSLLHRVIVLIGYFAADNVDNQAILQSGQRPSVLQQLCTLPFEYFSKPELKAVLMPTLIAACNGNEENLAILTEEMSYSMLEDFKMSKEGIDNKLLKRLCSL